MRFSRNETASASFCWRARFALVPQAATSSPDTPTEGDAESDFPAIDHGADADIEGESPA